MARDHVGAQLQVSDLYFCNWIPAIGYPRDFHVNYVRFDGFLRNVFYSFQNLEKRYKRFRSKEVLRRQLYFRNLLYIRLDLVSYNSGSNRARLATRAITP